MRKICMALLLVCFAAAADAQVRDTTEFMNDMRFVVHEIESETPLTQQSFDETCAYYKYLTTEYKTMKKQLNTAQKGEYQGLKMRFSKGRVQYKGKQLASDATGATKNVKESVSDTYDNVRERISGFLKGLVGK